MWKGLPRGTTARTTKLNPPTHNAASVSKTFAHTHGSLMMALCGIVDFCRVQLQN
mgnify:CR=1 FL=1